MCLAFLRDVSSLKFQDEAIAPEYATGYYQSTDAKPNQSEDRILNSYASDQRFPQTEQEMTVRLQALEGSQSQGML